MVVPFVTDYVWIGKVNFLLRRLKMNGVDDPETIEKAYELLQWQTNEKITQLYKAYQLHPKLKWKESIKKIVGIDVPEEKGLDI